MKKIISLLLALSMLFALCACGGSSKQDKANEYAEVALTHLLENAYSGPIFGGVLGGIKVKIHNSPQTITYDVENVVDEPFTWMDNVVAEVLCPWYIGDDKDNYFIECFYIDTDSNVSSWYWALDEDADLAAESIYYELLNNIEDAKNYPESYKAIAYQIVEGRNKALIPQDTDDWIDISDEHLQVMLDHLSSIIPQITPEPVVMIDVEAVVEIDGPFEKTTYYNHVLNEKGQIIEAKKTVDSSKYTVFYEYDDEGRLIKETTRGTYGDEVWTYTYDENGLLVEEFQGDRTFKNTYKLDKDGNILSQKYVNADNGYSGTYTYTYNDNGTIATKTENNKYITEFKYDDQNRVIQEITTEKGSTYKYYTVYKYDVVGSYLEE